jgi:hypothetical protein
MDISIFTPFILGYKSVASWRVKEFNCTFHYISTPPLCILSLVAEKVALTVSLFSTIKENFSTKLTYNRRAVIAFKGILIII